VIKTALILAGGFGTRLQSIVKDVPKPMAPINGIPFLDYQLFYLKQQGISQVILSVGHLFEAIRQRYQTNFNGLEIKYAIEDSPLGTGGAIRLAINQCDDEEVLALNGDSFFDISLPSFFEMHSSHKSNFSLALRGIENAARYGTIELSENRIVSFKEKTGQQVAGLINAGVYILNRSLFLQHTQAITFSIEKDFFEKHIQSIPIYGFQLPGYFIDIGIPEDFHQAQNDFKRFKYQ